MYSSILLYSIIELILLIENVRVIFQICMRNKWYKVKSTNFHHISSISAVKMSQIGRLIEELQNSQFLNGDTQNEKFLIEPKSPFMYMVQYKNCSFKFCLIPRLLNFLLVSRFYSLLLLWISVSSRL